MMFIKILKHNLCIVVLALLSGMFLSSNTEQIQRPLVFTNNQAKLNLVTSNVCVDYAQVIVTNGKSSSGIVPELGWACSNSQWFIFSYTPVDTLLNHYTAKDIALSGANSAQRHLFVAVDSAIYSYRVSYSNPGFCQPTIIPHDTLIIDSLIEIESVGSKVFAICDAADTSQPNFLVYDTLFNSDFNMHLNMKPLLLISDGALKALVVGRNQTNEIVLNIINLQTQMLVKDTVLGPLAANPFKIHADNWYLFLAASPGDSIISAVKYNFQNGNYQSAIIYSQSGINQAEWVDFDDLHFQPKYDAGPNALHKQILHFNAFTMQMTDTFYINRDLYRMVDPIDNSTHPSDYINLVPKDSLYPTWVYVYDIYNYQLVDSFQTPPFPSFFLNDFRCPWFGSVDEYDDSQIQMQVYPNPSVSDVTISLSGLICGRDYVIDIIDSNGKKYYEKSVHAKMSLSIPISELSSGMYFFRLHTKQGIKIQKIIKQ